MNEAVLERELSLKESPLIVLAAIGGLTLVIAKILPALSAHGGAEYDTFAATNFFQPSKVSELAASLAAESEDQFILNAWDWVGRSVIYESTPSDIEFEGDVITCLHCYTVDETLATGRGNCVNKSALLASILLNRLAAERVYMVIGGFAMDGVGGHAWLNVYRDNDWYLIEATSPPKSSPWIKVSSLGSIYVPYAIFSAADFRCVDHSVCLEVGACDCGKRIEELL